LKIPHVKERLSMTTKRMQSLISRMHNELNHLIESCNYDLSNEKVIKYSQKFDKVILTYNKALESDKFQENMD
jgi:heme oxygenase